MSNLASVFGSGFDVNTVEPQSDFDVLPPGKYPVQIDRTEVKQTKKGDGHYIEFAMTILDGPAKNRKLWDRINIDNPSQQCVDIGLRQLSALGRAVGVQVVSSEDQFLGKTCIASVKVKDNQNEIRTYSCLTSDAGMRPVTSPSTIQPLPQPQPQIEGFTGPMVTLSAVSTPDTKPPWAR